MEKKIVDCESQSDKRQYNRKYSVFYLFSFFLDVQSAFCEYCRDPIIAMMYCDTLYRMEFICIPFGRNTSSFVITNQQLIWQNKFAVFNVNVDHQPYNFDLLLRFFFGCCRCFEFGVFLFVSGSFS